MNYSGQPSYCGNRASLPAQRRRYKPSSTSTSTRLLTDRFSDLAWASNEAQVSAGSRIVRLGIGHLDSVRPATTAIGLTGIDGRASVLFGPATGSRAVNVKVGAEAESIRRDSLVSGIIFSDSYSVGAGENQSLSVRRVEWVDGRAVEGFHRDSSMCDTTMIPHLVNYLYLGGL